MLWNVTRQPNTFPRINNSAIHPNSFPSLKAIKLSISCSRQPYQLIILIINFGFQISYFEFLTSCSDLAEGQSPLPILHHAVNLAFNLLPVSYTTLCSCFWYKGPSICQLSNQRNLESPLPTLNFIRGLAIFEKHITWCETNKFQRNNNKKPQSQILGLNMDPQQIGQGWSHLFFFTILFYPKSYSLLLPSLACPFILLLLIICLVFLYLFLFP